MTKRYSEAILTCRDTKIAGDGLDNYVSEQSKNDNMAYKHEAQSAVDELRDSGMNGAAEWADARLNAPTDIPEDTLDKIETFEQMGWDKEAARYRKILSYSDEKIDEAILARQ